MKILPIELVEVIHAAHLSLKGDEKYQLRPFYRQLIYQAIGSLGTYNTVQIRGWLAVLTARYILSARQHALPDDGRLLEEVLVLV